MPIPRHITQNPKTRNQITDPTLRKARQSRQALLAQPHLLDQRPAQASKHPRSTTAAESTSSIVPSVITRSQSKTLIHLQLCIAHPEGSAAQDRAQDPANTRPTTAQDQAQDQPTTPSIRAQGHQSEASIDTDGMRYDPFQPGPNQRGF
ncbi:hypothetical protein CVT26_009047 [Gymnopilus dilepis]|uniref:Uncharacterized protein n=1 Tax=Gymnopilus dilepis TaxID=231916 RepID=A0A409YB04_9AGAR|nr:hypothetical protein CVT26_009047 [Gymnopilus dilepis]